MTSIQARLSWALAGVLMLAGSSAHAQSIACGTYAAEARPSTSTSCPGGSQQQSCSHSQLDAPLLDCSGASVGQSCVWTSEVTPVGGCTTCTAWANQCSPRVCAPSVCSGGSYLEVCDGFDNDGGGQVDEGCPLPDGSGDGLTYVSFLHAATGQLVPPPRRDVHYAGTALPIVFSRAYTSLDYWPYEIGSRIAAGWFHTYDERLYDASTFGPPSQSSSEIIHRRGARGRRFTCMNQVCGTNDGSLDRLEWVSSGSYWRLTGGDGVRTDFFGTGADWQKGALWRRQTTRGVGWTVAYYTSGALASHIQSVTDELGRRLDFDWQPASTDGAPARLVGLKDKGGTTLATFGYGPYARLTSATSVAGAETYAYAPDASNRTTRLLTSVTVGGQALFTATYDLTAGEGWVGRVASLLEADASLRLRYRGATRNACASASESTMIVDRATDPVGSSCTDDASGDSWCAAQAGMPAVCDAGTCRAIACQRYGDLVNGAGEDRVTAITGNCPCRGISTMGWTSGGSEAPRRVAWEVTRDGRTTSFAYDSRGRRVARCANDDNTSVTTTSSSCPNAGDWGAWEYGHASFPTLLTKERARSRLDATAEHTTTLTYDANHPELTQVSEAGITRTAANDTNVTETQVTSYVYDTSGRLTQETLPAGEVTSFTYHTNAGNGFGLLQTVERWLNGGATRLITTHDAYTPLGWPGSITAPSTAVATYGYDYGGMRPTSRTLAGEQTTYTYAATGRLEEIIEPSGRRTRYTYDARGRVQYEDVRDAQGSAAADRTEYAYDAAGRRTNVLRRRLDGSGNPLSASWQLQATYDERGYTLTRQYGARAAIQHQTDADGMGRLVSIEREDGDLIEMSHDVFGRELEYRQYFTGSSSGAYTSSYTSPSGKETASSLPTTVTDPESVQRSYQYDDFGNLLRSSSNDFGTIRWGYTSGRLTERKLGNGLRSTYAYDELGRITTINHDADNPSLVGQDYQFIYDNGGLQCTISGSTCAYRRGRLAKARLESSPGTFWDIEYDYGQHGRVTAERWPSSRQTNYTYDASGRLLRISLPVPTSDKIRYEYDATNNDGEDPSELRRIVHELTAGQDYLVWGRTIQHDALGRQVRAHFADRADGTNPSIDLAYNTDGTVSQWRVRRRSNTLDVDMMNRAYAYWGDGVVRGWTSSVGADPARSFFRDGANRLTCAASTAGLSQCPTGQGLLESYTYDLHENRATMVTPAGTTTYSNPYANNQLWDEYPPSHTIWYAYDTAGGRAWDRHASVGTSNQRNYYYYGSGRLRSIVMPAPGAQQGTYDTHTFTLLYDHRGRLVYVVDKNNTTGIERREQLYWDLGDRLIERVITPNHTAPSTYSVDIFADLESAATGWMRLEYVNGSFSSETRRYVARDPIGLVPAVWTFTGVGSTTVVYTADHQPYGEVRASSGSTHPSLSMRGQIVLPQTASRIWSGQQVITLRSELAIEHDRVWDARVGQYFGALPGTSGMPGIDHPYAGEPAGSPSFADLAIPILPRIRPPLFGARSFRGEPERICFEFSTPLTACGVCAAGEACIRIAASVMSGAGAFEVASDTKCLPSDMFDSVDRNGIVTDHLQCAECAYQAGVTTDWMDCTSRPSRLGDAFCTAVVIAPAPGRDVCVYPPIAADPVIPRWPAPPTW